MLGQVRKMLIEDALEDEVTDFYFNLYRKDWNVESVKAALSGVPSINIMDDHDLFDGYGSYPEVLGGSQVFQNLGRIGILFYLLFQHHTTYDLAKADGYFGVNSYSYTRQLGPRTAGLFSPFSLLVVMIDARTERTLGQCLSQDSWKMVEKHLMEGLAPSTKHLLFVAGVPVIHPRLEFADKAMGCFGSTKDSLNKAANVSILSL
jgi:hypothetical protein